MPSELTLKQRKFVEAFKGNATEAARVAGYKGNDVTLAAVGAENLRKPQILEAIRQRNAGEQKKRIATREDRQAFWTGIMRDEAKELRDRLKASELLGKSEADFIERREVSGPKGGPIQTATMDVQALEAAIGAEGTE
jgi:phage terminase small subunit